jgi:hypothetical protein
MQQAAEIEIVLCVPSGTGAWKNQVVPRSTRPKNFQ